MPTHVWTHGEAAVANILKLAPKLWDLWRGDYIHMTFIIPQISLLSRHFLQTRYRLLLTRRWQKYVAYLFMYFIQLFVRTCSYHYFSSQNISAITNYSSIICCVSIQTNDHAQEICINTTRTYFWCIMIWSWNSKSKSTKVWLVGLSCDMCTTTYLFIITEGVDS